jgi:hypothetical protein
VKHRLLALCLVACSNGLNGETTEGDESARLLPRDVGVFVSEMAASGDAGALEVIVPGTHQRFRVEGFGIDRDMQARRVVDPTGREHIFTLQASQGVIVERDRHAQSLATHRVYDEGKQPGSANPRDLAYAPDGSLWVTRGFETSLVILNDKGVRTGAVDLKAFADDDGRPDMSAIAIVGETAYVALRRLEKGFGTTKNDSTVVAINTKTLEPRAFVTLPAKNPSDKFKLRNNALYVACIAGPVSIPPDENAALVKIDLATGVASKVFDAKAAGGFVTAFELADDATGYAIVAAFGGDNPTSLVRFDPTRGVRLDADPWARTSGYSLWDLGLLPNSGLLLVADRSKDAPGLRILSTRDGARLGHIPTRLEPVEFFFLRSPDA